MKGKFRLIFCNDFKLTIEFLQGDIYLEDLVALFQKQVEHPAYSTQNNVLTDVRNATLKITREETEKLVKHISGYGFLMIKKKVAFLTKEPNHVVATTIFSLNMKDSNNPQLINVYSTVPGVLEWLKLPWTENEYDELLYNTEKSTYTFVDSE